MYARFAAGLPAFLKQRVTPASARATILSRLASREENFLSLVRGAVFEHPRSPYLFILRDAGCSFDDVQQLVRAEGLDAALAALERSGVRVSFDELKGRAPLVRGGQTFDGGAAAFDNPLGRRSFVAESTGSSGVPTRVNMELDHVGALAPSRLMSLEAAGVSGWPTVVYRPGLPSSAGIGPILQHVVMGNPVRRWFSPVAPAELNAPLRFRAAGRMMPLLARIAGQEFPVMELVPFSDAVRVAREVRAIVKAEGRCLIRCAVSTSLTVAVAAVDAGIDLTGATFIGAAEPATDAKVRGIRRSGAEYVTSFGMNEAGMVGAGCARGVDQTDLHFMRDALAIVKGSQRIDHEGDSLSPFLLSTLLPTAPKILINVDTDDIGILEERQCGCLLGDLGFSQHLRKVRSTSKLTGRGVTLVGSDIVRIIEDVLPSRFGGNPQDYQLVEEEDATGLTMLTLLINPDIRLESETAPASVIYEALAKGRPGASFSGAILKGNDSVRVRRERPMPNSRGKQPAFRIAASRTA